MIIRAGVVVGLAGVAAASMAQTNGPSGISVRLGAFFPTNSASRALNSTWFAGGLDYKLKAYEVASAKEGSPAYLSISADYYESHGSRDIPVALNYNLRQDQFVFSAGIGPDFRRLGTDTRVGFSGQLGVAYDFGNNTQTPFFVAGKYFFASKNELSGFGAYVGMRF